MTELIERGNTLPQDLTQAATDALKRRLAEQMELSARHLVEMAAIWTELERRGEDLSALRTGLTDYLPRIAAGELDAHAVVQFAGHRQLLRYLSTLPIERQRHLLEVGEVDLVLAESGETTRRKLAHLSGREVTQVFGHGLVRSPADQARLMTAKTATQRAQARRSKKAASVRIRYGALEVDGERVTAGGKPLRADDLLELLSKHYGVDLANTIRGGSQ
jgi:hypothetical protein